MRCEEWRGEIEVWTMEEKYGERLKDPRQVTRLYQLHHNLNVFNIYYNSLYDVYVQFVIVIIIIFFSYQLE